MTNSTELTGHDCRICGASALREFERFRSLKRVTSDSRPWDMGGRLTICCQCNSVQKVVESDWLEDIGRIYRSYAIYHQANGDEQPIFAVGGAAPLPRSLALARYLEQKVQVPEQARVLDFGCGTGAALRTYSARQPKWTLYGAELSPDSLASLREIPGFVKLFTCPPAEIHERFDLITSVHALEHVLDPVGTIRDLSRRLTNGGALFAQVPDAGANPYDLVIADHLLHFTLETLRLAAQHAGCRILEVTDAALPKELTLIAQSQEPPQRPDALTRDPHQAVERVHAQLDWLFAQIDSAAAIARECSHFGLFGTSISATWLGGQLNDRVSFFVDEDEGRVGRQHMGRPILAPGQVGSDVDVYVPLVPYIAASIAHRLSRPGVRFHVPPPLSRVNYKP